MTTETVPVHIPLLAGIACESDSTETVPLTEERSFGIWQQDIPEQYAALEPQEISERIRFARQRLGTRSIVLGHHSQREANRQYPNSQRSPF